MNKKKVIANGLLVCGVIMVLSALSIFLYMKMAENRASQQIEIYIEQLQQGMPELRETFEEERINTNMPMMEVEGENFVAILKVPLYEAVLPIGSSWENDRVAKYPCRYEGSLYDGSMIIGGSDYKGQLDFAEDISIGDIIEVTDMLGARYSYTVSWVEKTEKITQKYLEDEHDKLTIFIKHQYGSDYTVIRCAK